MYVFKVPKQTNNMDFFVLQLVRLFGILDFYWFYNWAFVKSVNHSQIFLVVYSEVLCTEASFHSAKHLQNHPGAII